jgi:prepilin-type N-terminal cleavage/methylation domain-containing protein
MPNAEGQRCSATVHSAPGTRSCFARASQDKYSTLSGFTLLELLVALVILVTAFTIIWSSFSATINAWRRGSEALDDLHHGDFVMEQVVSALRSAAFFSTAPHKYGFHLRDRDAAYPNDMISLVVSGTVFIPEGSPLAQGLHRLVMTVEPNDEGEDAFAVRAFPHLAEIDDDEEDPWFISSVVKGIECRVYNIEDEVWESDWEDTNSIPSVLEVTLYMEPTKQYGDPMTIKRLVEIPIAPAVTQAVKWAESGQGPRGEDQPGGDARGGEGGGANISGGR